MNSRHDLSVAVTVWGEGACFTRPEFKVERVTYPVITFPAARGILEAIFWKKELRWKITKIVVHEPGTSVSITRNEVMNVATTTSDTRSFDTAQRTMVYLKEVCYTIHARPIVVPEARANNNPRKYQEQFNRRVQRGQCFHTPYLGTREFSAHFSVADPGRAAIPWNQDLGPMHSGFDYTTTPTTPQFNNYTIRKGVLTMGDRIV